MIEAMILKNSWSLNLKTYVKRTIRTKLKTSIASVYFLLWASIILFASCSGPDEHFKKQIQGPLDLPYNPDVEKIKSEGDVIRQNVAIVENGLPAQDEIVLQEDLGRAFVASMDGWIWKVNLSDNSAEKFVKPPLLPAGMIAHPKNSDIIYVCVSRGNEDDDLSQGGPGIYEVTISQKKIRMISSRVPLADKTMEPNEGNIGVVYTPQTETKIKFAQMTGENSRPVEKADDLTISSDGKRLYFTEPYDHPNSILGVSKQSKHETLTLGRNGYIWKYDLEDQSASLVAHQYSYLDGILLEYGNGENPGKPSAQYPKENSIVANELSKSRLVRIYLSGEKSGKDEIAIEGLPGFPDGMDRDEKGNIWIALPVERSNLITWLHKNPFWKKIVLYVPVGMLPVSKKTGIIALSPDAAKPLYYAMHDGSLFSYIIVVVPGKEKLYLAVYQDGFRGLVTMPYPN